MTLLYKVLPEEFAAMNCWRCRAKLIWGDDPGIEDRDDCSVGSSVVCPKCSSYIEEQMPKEFDK